MRNCSIKAIECAVEFDELKLFADLKYPYPHEFPATYILTLLRLHLRSNAEHDDMHSMYGIAQGNDSHPTTLDLVEGIFFFPGS